MKVYFYSKIDAILKINGQYVGKVSKNVTFTLIEDNSLIEFLPLNDDYCSLSVFNFKSNLAKIYKLKNSLLICPVFTKKRNAPYKIISQTEVNVFDRKHLLTILSDGFYKFHLNGDFYVTDELPFVPDNFNVETRDNLVFITFTLYKKCLFVYTIKNNQLSLCFKDVIDDFSYTTYQLKTFKSYNLISKIDVTETWQFNNGFTLINTTCEYDKNLNMANLKIKGLLFLNLLILNGNITDFLANNLIEKSSNIKEFLHYPFIAFENFETNIDDEYLILTKSGAKCVKFSFLNNLICDFSVDDY